MGLLFVSTSLQVFFVSFADLVTFKWFTDAIILKKLFFLKTTLNRWLKVNWKKRKANGDFLDVGELGTSLFLGRICHAKDQLVFL